MLKVLVAGNKNYNSKLILTQILKNIKNVNLKIVGYNNYLPDNYSAEFTLDSLFSPYKSNLLNQGKNYDLYIDMIKAFSPDLIITDLEITTSFIALDLNIPLWQYSSTLIRNALDLSQKIMAGYYKYNEYLFYYPEKKKEDVIIQNSAKNLVCSHFPDYIDLSLKNNFEFVRPFYTKEKDNLLYSNNIFAINPNKKIINKLLKTNDSVFYSNNIEKFDNLKKIFFDDFYLNLKNTRLAICDGSAMNLADIFYNNKFSLIFSEEKTMDNVINSGVSVFLGLSKFILESDDIEDYRDINILPNLNNKILNLNDHLKMF